MTLIGRRRLQVKKEREFCVDVEKSRSDRKIQRSIAGLGFEIGRNGDLRGEGRGLRILESCNPGENGEIAIGYGEEFSQRGELIGEAARWRTRDGGVGLFAG
jgi:hypothetical protein